MIRAFFRAAKVETAQRPYDTLTLKIYYPAKPGDSDIERNTGVVPADVEKAPFPVVVFLPGINVGPESYAWLAVKLAEAGSVVVTYAWIAEEMPGFISLTPGLDFSKIMPESYGSGPTCPALPPILAVMEDLQKDGVLTGTLDLDRVYFGGHSAGATMALQNANADWFPQLKGVFSYAGHTAAATVLGYPEGTVLPISGTVPVLLIGGTRDGVIAGSTGRYEKDAGPDPTRSLNRTFHEAVPTGKESAYLLVLEGANHFLAVHPLDPTTGRHFLDWAPTESEDDQRDFLGKVMITFIQNHQNLNKIVSNEDKFVAAFESK